MSGWRREIEIAVANGAILLLLGIGARSFFSAGNLADLFLSNMPVMLIALGMTGIILTGHIDISVGSLFAVCSVLAGVTARAGAPAMGYVVIACAAGALVGAINGALTAYLRLPSIVVTLATMVALRDGLRWATQGAWVDKLPPEFQQFNMKAAAFTTLTFTLTTLLTVGFALGLRYLRTGRAVYATGSNEEAARRMGINTKLAVLCVFTLAGALTGLAAVLNAVRFHQIASNTGMGLEMSVIAAVAVGGATITGGSASITGTVLGVILLSIIGPAFTFLGVSAYWEQALQGAIILAAVSAKVLERWRGGDDTCQAGAHLT